MPVYLLVMIVVHQEVHTVVVSELQLREINTEANRQLRVLMRSSVRSLYAMT